MIVPDPGVTLIDHRSGAGKDRSDELLTGHSCLWGFPPPRCTVAMSSLGTTESGREVRSTPAMGARGSRTFLAGQSNSPWSRKAGPLKPNRAPEWEVWDGRPAPVPATQRRVRVGDPRGPGPIAARP